ncbi:DUF2264 domain-containing protein [Kiritimatiellaeota bacterium B1221]|nr:DUF2264 domain-containing protein [Kiritimatiellaeota bacterium B1221]
MTPSSPFPSRASDWKRPQHLAFLKECLQGFAQDLDPDSGKFIPPPSWESSRTWQIATDPNQPGTSDASFYTTEAWERVIVGLAHYLKGSGEILMHPQAGDLGELFRQRLIHGCTPGHPDHFGPVPPGRQTGAYIPLALLTAPEQLFDPLTSMEQENVLSWLAEGLNRPSHHNNHYLFHLQAIPLLDRYGFAYDTAHAEQLLDQIMAFYSGGGWFQDGSSLSYDYYNAWGFQYYLLNLIYFHKPWRDRLGDRIRGISRQFFRDYRLMFAHDGAAVPYGRSLSYRFGAMDPIPWAVLLEDDFWPEAPADARRILSANFHYHHSHGCFDANGRMESGYHQVNPALTEPYLSPASCNWALTSFAHLLLPEDHAFWTEPAPPTPETQTVHPLSGPQWLLSRPAAGNVKLYPTRTPRPDWPGWQIPAKYYGRVYDTDIGYALDPESNPTANRFQIRWQDEKCWQELPEALSHSLNERNARSIFPTPRGPVILDVIALDAGEVFVLSHSGETDLYLCWGGSGLQRLPDTALTSTESPDGMILRTSSMSNVLQLLQGRKGPVKIKTLDANADTRHAHLFGGNAAWIEMEIGPIKKQEAIILYHHALPQPDAHFPNAPIEILDPRPGMIELKTQGQRISLHL